ncbi:MAG: MFS transporter [Gammaproteobacteria bacterium]|uniref:MFS transporter n=1 Tax=Candidatus Thiopontia autotrophica TaxID=2841688 RepID=A0A8J6NZA8_9GAMM|nr:MFS transporter [Candidatus Thiopontia autotrophica]MBL6968938.1 MFS transporter [Gammaproteobacteria bacterium]
MGKLTPYLWVLFLNAFVDLGHKITIQNSVFKVYDGEMQIVLTALVNALILIPFILLVTPAGIISDRLPKVEVMRRSAGVAVIIALLITLSYYQGWFEAAFFMTLLLAIQSAFFSPAKYGYIREHVGMRGLTSANGVVQAVTIIAILLGMFFFSFLFELMLTNSSPDGGSAYLQTIAPLGWLLVALSLVEWRIARYLPEGEYKVVPEIHGGHTLGLIREHSVIWYSILGLSLFWGISQVSIAAFPAFAKETLQVTNTLVIQGVLASAGGGILLGSLMVTWLSRGYIETGLIPVGAVGVAIALSAVPGAESLHSLTLLFFLMGVSGGLLIVPLNALIQFYAKSSRLGRILAGNNWVQNIVMLLFLGVTMGVALLSFETTVNPATLFWGIAMVAWAAIGVAFIRRPRETITSLIRMLVRVLFRCRYRIDAVGVTNIPSQKGALLLGNHISWLDWAMLQAVSPRPIRFVMEYSIYQKPSLKWFLDLFEVIPISAERSRQPLEEAKRCLQSGDLVCLFPEGAISHDGCLGKFRRGFEMIVDDSGAVIVPFYIEGLWGSRFSRADMDERSLYATGWRRREVQVLFGEPVSSTVKADELRLLVAALSSRDCD